MNFLAHLYLSCEDEDLTVGNFLADFIRNKDVKSFSEGVQKGILLHRRIDSYTDNHPLVRQGTKRLRPVHRKYSPVVLDVFYDYILANNWEKYSHKALKQFTGEIYQFLIKRIVIMPAFVQLRLPLMIADDWLFRYGMEEGLRKTFERMKRRTSHPELLENAVDSLMADYSAYEEEFNAFFPEVIDFVKDGLMDKTHLWPN